MEIIQKSLPNHMKLNLVSVPNHINQNMGSMMFAT